ncbi:M20/M25/M40 family metallo-hydrolase [Sporosarcina sp. ACRSL]|uniref:M20/M25/M40 family metallo-hydrolase n=1 Tax=Sporosarcina sp. ACRSL TaxID=2918215 RepID=UPI001EF46D5C|nr:M20/M25/M40 family metallo-hydrolase [Sporosarcina sp. ACRSL]MCG7344007.1 M20/M25/M40 family metallo-hydrolase [Sporosarcina sp. ACRSL]
MDFIEVKNRIEENKEEYMETFLSLLRQPSISSTNYGIEDCAELLKTIMERAGIDVKVMPTDGSPVVYGEVIHPDNNFTILFYGHYDVQPADPLESWISPPFEPTIRNGRVYARGAGDNKGQLLAHILAVKTLLDTYGKLPINVKFLYDGEEENSSLNFEPFVRNNKTLLKADVVYTADGPMDPSGKPMVLLGNRGMLYIKMRAKGASHDNHSGNKGGIAPNPAWKLIHLLNTMVTPEGKVLIDGFYDDIRKPTKEESSILRNLPFDPIETAKVVGVDKIDLDAETYYGRIAMQPTFNINGLYSGYTEDGQKTIIPSTATVTIDMRLAADQNPEKIYSKIVEHINVHAPDIEIEKMGSTKPSRTSVNLEVVQTILGAVRDSYEQEPIILPAIGATMPGYVFTDILAQPAVLVPYANADEDNHAPNENMDIDCYYKGIQTSCKVLMDLGEKYTENGTRRKIEIGKV